jgi:hypothetical protein
MEEHIKWELEKSKLGTKFEETEEADIRCRS